LKAQQDAHKANQNAGVAREEEINAWRKGFTPNSGPILSLNQQREIPDGYTVHFENMKDNLQAQQDAHWTEQKKRVADEEAANVWRGEKYVYPEVTLSQHRTSSTRRSLD
jgi:nitrogen fixation/metabolism regulation signal transduction histidine kinase